MQTDKTNKDQASFELVESRKDLCRIADDLSKQDAIGVDLEADSMFHYREKVCLIQISAGSRNILIDPLAQGDLSPLAPVFCDHRVRKVFHGADYDIRSLHRDFGITVAPLFDTQIAARFLGLTEISLASLLLNRFGLHLEKKYQKKDWSRRPLSDDMLAYAVQDSSHLVPLASILMDELRAKGRIPYVEEECELLSHVRSATNNSGGFFLKFKGAGRLDKRSLAVLEAILQFRDELARRIDRPHFKVIGNGPIMEMARLKPLTLSELEAITGLSTRQVENMGRSLLKKIREAQELPEDALPLYPRKVRVSVGSKVSARVKALKKWRDQSAGKMAMDSSLVCTNAQIQSLALANPGDPKNLDSIVEMRDWQRELFGHEICSLLRDVA